MKGLSERLRSPLVFKVSLLAFGCLAFFFLGKRWSEHYPEKLVFYNSGSSNAIPRSSDVGISPNANKKFNISSLIDSVNNQTLPSPPPPSPPPPHTFGVVDGNGTMRDDFDPGDFDLGAGENDTDLDLWNTSSSEGLGIRVRKFPLCPVGMKEYIPCLDNEEAIRKLESTAKGEKYERHCPEREKTLNCLVPAPNGYKYRIPWPRSRDEVWFTNVPHTRLVEDKGGQNWITREKDKFKFPGGGTQFIHGADKYLDQISEMLPEISFGQRTRVVLDVGCGVASFGAYLFSKNVITMSIAPKDVHENQIQFALERGVPAMVAAFATRRLLYPSQAFDLIHCSRCRINWTRDDGILLLEVNRLLRGGGYFVWAAQPVYKHEEAQQEAWKEMEDLTRRMCWTLVQKGGYIAIWQKPVDNSCYVTRDTGTRPPLCNADDNPDEVWYVNLTACISRIPENNDGTNLTAWPARLQHPPNRLRGVEMDAFMAKDEIFMAETRYWSSLVEGYIKAFKWKNLRLRNIMDMRAGFGGFAAALINQQINAWVMNIVPTSGPNTLPVIFDRGLIGAAHDWCEAFDTYPRSYDLLLASGLFFKEQKRCNITIILLEMDRILRPGGRVYVRDTVGVVEQVKQIVEAMGWRADIGNTEEGPFSSRRQMRCDKPLH
ncbi:putative methyltransferase PMT12 [Wolffia australiana]